MGSTKFAFAESIKNLSKPSKQKLVNECLKVFTVLDKDGEVFVSEIKRGLLEHFGIRISYKTLNEVLIFDLKLQKQTNRKVFYRGIKKIEPDLLKISIIKSDYFKDE